MLGNHVYLLMFHSCSIDISSATEPSCYMNTVSVKSVLFIKYDYLFIY